MFKRDHVPEIDPAKTKKIISGTVIAIVVLLILIKSIIVIPAGVTGVYHLFGKVRDKELHYIL